MSVEVRAASPGDAETISRLTVESYEEYAATLGPEEWEKMRAGLVRTQSLTAGPASPMVAEEDGEMLGFVAYFPPGTSNPSLFPIEWASIRLLAVSPAHRGKGVGRTLAGRCVELARKDGAGMIGLHTSELMHSARALYEKMGFRPAGELPAMFGVRYRRYVLALDG